MTRHLIIPDTQIKPDCPIEHMYWAGRYAVAMKPNVIVHLGDHWDMPSLSLFIFDLQQSTAFKGSLLFVSSICTKINFKI